MRRTGPQAGRWRRTCCEAGTTSFRGDRSHAGAPRARRRAAASAGRGRTATVIVVGKPERLVAAAGALEQLGEAGGVRAILIAEGEHTAPIARVTESAIAISGLAPRYLNNAVAALRLSSLPAVVWWRGGSVEALDDLANLADRLILDTAQPDAVWARADTLFEKTALTDLRWTCLTRWRAAVAHLFDLAQVRRGAGAIRTLRIEATTRIGAAVRRLAEIAAGLTAAVDRVRAVAGRPDATDRVTPPERGSPRCGAPRQLLSKRASRRRGDARIVPWATAPCLPSSAKNCARTRDLAFEQALVTAREIRHESQHWRHRAGDDGAQPALNTKNTDSRRGLEPGDGVDRCVPPRPLGQSSRAKIRGARGASSVRADHDDDPRGRRSTR